jgi:hypothetical protein
MELTEKQIIARIRAHGRGFVFTTKVFSSLVNDSAGVRTALTRLVQKQSIRRLSHGLYDLPIIHPQLGALVPSVENVIEAIKSADANLLGLSTQIPMRIELYTNGPRRKIRYGNQEILLKPTTPKNMVGAGTKAGLILHALRQIGQDNVTDEMIAQIRSKIMDQDIKHIKKQIPYAPAWVAKIMRSLINEKES